MYNEIFLVRSNEGVIVSQRPEGGEWLYPILGGILGTVSVIYLLPRTRNLDIMRLEIVLTYTDL